MYCTKCGKETNNADAICNNCAKLADAPISDVKKNETSQGVDKLFGLEHALVAIIGGILGFLFTMTIQTQPIKRWGSIVILIVASVATVLGVVFGSVSIKDYKEALRRNVKVDKTLAMGIIGLCFGMFDFFMLINYICLGG